MLIEQMTSLLLEKMLNRAGWTKTVKNNVYRENYIIWGFLNNIKMADIRTFSHFQHHCLIDVNKSCLIFYCKIHTPRPIILDKAQSGYGQKTKSTELL